MESCKFIFTIISNPPAHLGHDELERQYQDFTKPLLSSVYRYPDVPLTMYFSGPYLEWLQKHHSEYLTVLTEMIRRKQVEILGGGFYSPVLPLIPHNDRIGQIEDLTTTVRRLLGRRPRGAYLVESIWEPHLVTNLVNTGMEFSFLEASGLPGGADLDGHYPFLTEHQGKTLVIFPYSGDFTRRIIQDGAGAFKQALEVRSGKDDAILCLVLSGDFYGEDREKAHQFVHGGGLQGLLDAFRSSPSEVEGSHPSTYLKKGSVLLRKHYLNNSNEEQLWKSGERELWNPSVGSASSNFRQFLTRFPVINNLYGKMMFIHLLAYQIRRDKYKKKSALEDLWRAQAAWAYFPWKHQGAHLNSVRKTAYGYLLQAELKARDKASFVPNLSLQDFNMDGQKEILYQGNAFNFYLGLRGGQIFELDCLKHLWNYADVFSLTGEKPSGITCFADRFYDPDTFLDFRSATPEDLGDFCDRDYRAGEVDRDQKTASVSLRGSLRVAGGSLPVKIEKTYQFKEQGLRVSYSLEGLSPQSGNFIFVPEIRLSFKDQGKEKLFFTGNDEVWGTEGGHLNQWKDFQIHDRSFGLRISLSATKEGQLSCYPEVLTLSGGVSLYQGHRILPRIPVSLAYGETCNFSLDLSFQNE